MSKILNNEKKQIICVGAGSCKEVHGEDFLEGDLPRAEGEGSQGVWGVSDEEIGVGGVG